MSDVSYLNNVAESRPAPSDSRSGTPPEVSIIIVNWNSKDYLRQCLTSIFKHCPRVGLEIIVVDSGSFDGSGEMLACEFPSAVFVQSAENIGFARANNLGAHHSRGRYLLFLNPDTEFTQDSLQVFCAHIRSLSDAGAIGCRLLNSDRTVQTSCVQSFPTVLNQVLDSDLLQRWFPRSGLWGSSVLHSVQRTAAEVEVVSGACIFMKRSVFERIGGFTENYFMYGEDLDLCFKVRRAGYVVYHVDETRVIHHGRGSSQRTNGDFSDVMMRESVYRFLRLNRGSLSAACYRISMAGAALIRVPLIATLLVFGRVRPVSLRKWWLILCWSLGLEIRAIANISSANKLNGVSSQVPVLR